MPKLMSIPELQKEFGLSRMQVRWLVKRHNIPTVKVPQRPRRSGLRIAVDHFIVAYAVAKESGRVRFY